MIYSNFKLLSDSYQINQKYKFFLNLNVMHHAAKSFLILNSVGSTNNYAMGIIRDGLAEHGNAVFTYEQTHGKGSMGKVWNSQKGKNIALSIILAPQILTIYQQFHLSVTVALGCTDFLKNYAGDEIKIKWPNDIFWNDRKAGGILVENVINGNVWQWAVAGVGININQIAFDLDSVFPPVSLKQITGKDFDVLELARELYEKIMNRFEMLVHKGFEKMLKEYNQNLFGLEKNVKLKKENVVFETMIKGVSQQGQLIAEDVMERKFDFNEVSWLRE